MSQKPKELIRWYKDQICMLSLSPGYVDVVKTIKDIIYSDGYHYNSDIDSENDSDSNNDSDFNNDSDTDSDNLIT